MLRRLAACATAFAVYALTIFAPALDMAQASQNALSSPTTGTVTGLNLTNNFNSALDSLNTCNSGASAPTNQLSGVPSAGNCWLNTTSSPYPHEEYDGGNWLTPYWLDAVNHYTLVKIGGGATTIASAATVDLCNGVPQSAITISGTTTINSFGSTCNTGHFKVVQFSGILTLTYNAASMILPTAANITTAAGDTAWVEALGSGNWQVVFYQRASGAALSTAGLNVGASALGNSALSPLEMPVNFQLGTSVGSNQLTVSLCTLNSGSSTCNNPSSSNPILIAFRDPTQANGDPVIISLQAALSFTIGSGSTMGCVSGQACRLRVYAIDEGGTVALCAYNSLSGTSIIGLNEGVLQKTGSGTGGGSSAQTLYCSTASTSTAYAVRELGYIDITESSAGTWALNASVIQLAGSGYLKAGAVVQSIYVPYTSLTSTSNNYTPSGTAPTTAQGGAGPSASIAPVSQADVIDISSLLLLGNNSSSAAFLFTSYLYNGSAVLAAAQVQFNNAAGTVSSGTEIALRYRAVAGGTSSVTYTVYFSSNNGITYTNGEGSTTFFGGAVPSFLEIKELAT